MTDGVNLWVVNDSTTDKVFKYTLSGSLVGSWTIAGAGSSPTGITLDPAHVGNLWIVDSGTKRVYQFDNAAGLDLRQSLYALDELRPGRRQHQPPGHRRPAVKRVAGSRPIVGSVDPGLSTLSIPRGSRRILAVPCCLRPGH